MWTCVLGVLSWVNILFRQHCRVVCKMLILLFFEETYFYQHVLYYALPDPKIWQCNQNIWKKKFSNLSVHEWNWFELKFSSSDLVEGSMKRGRVAQPSPIFEKFGWVFGNHWSMTVANPSCAVMILPSPLWKFLYPPLRINKITDDTTPVTAWKTTRKQFTGKIKVKIISNNLTCTLMCIVIFTNLTAYCL